MESSKETELRLTRENFSVNAARQSDAEYQLTGGYLSINAARRSTYKKQCSTPQVDPVERCQFCGITSPSHVREECPALTRECHKCKQVGHFAAVCKWTRQNRGKHPRLLDMCLCIVLVFAKKINLYLSVSNMDPIRRPKCAGSRIAAQKLTPCRSKITCSLAQDRRSCHQTQTECTPLMVGYWIPQASFRPICNLEGMFVPPQFKCSRTSKLHFSVKVHAIIWDCWKRIGPSLGF